MCLPAGIHAQIPLLAEVLDSSAAFGLQSESPDPELQSRCEIIARQCGHLANKLKPDPELTAANRDSMAITHLDRIETILGSLHTIPSDPDNSSSGAPPVQTTSLANPFRYVENREHRLGTQNEPVCNDLLHRLSRGRLARYFQSCYDGNGRRTG